MDNPLQVLNLIAQTIFQKKGFNIVAIDVRDVSTMTDFFIIAEGNSDRHVISIGQAILEAVEESTAMKPSHAEGLSSGEWVVIDYLEIVVHLFVPGLRDIYRLDQVWSAGKIVELKLLEASLGK